MLYLEGACACTCACTPLSANGVYELKGARVLMCSSRPCWGAPPLHTLAPACTRVCACVYVRAWQFLPRRLWLRREVGVWSHHSALTLLRLAQSPPTAGPLGLEYENPSLCPSHPPMGQGAQRVSHQSPLLPRPPPAGVQGVGGLPHGTCSPHHSPGDEETEDGQPGRAGFGHGYPCQGETSHPLSSHRGPC